MAITRKLTATYTKELCDSMPESIPDTLMKDLEEYIANEIKESLDNEILICLLEESGWKKYRHHTSVIDDETKTFIETVSTDEYKIFHNCIVMFKNKEDYEKVKAWYILKCR